MLVFRYGQMFSDGLLSGLFVVLAFMSVQSAFFGPSKYGILPEILPHHLGGLGSDYVNGAVVAGLLDASLGVAGAVHYLGQPAGTVELSIKFIRAIHGPTITAYAVALKRSESVCFVEGKLFSEGRLCALASGLVALASSAEGADELRW